MADEIIDSLLESIREKQSEIAEILKAPEVQDIEIDDLLQGIINAQDELNIKVKSEVGKIQVENYAEDND